MNEEKKMEITNRITDILYDIGMPANLQGFHYLRYGILLAYGDYENARRVTKFLYPKIAEEFVTTDTRVERCIRHAIEMAFDAGNDVYKYLGRNPYAKTGRSTNSQFIMTLADRLLREDNVRPTV